MLVRDGASMSIMMRIYEPLRAALVPIVAGFCVSVFHW